LLLVAVVQVRQTVPAGPVETDLTFRELSTLKVVEVVVALAVVALPLVVLVDLVVLGQILALSGLVFLVRETTAALVRVL
jgi:hypothetical protein